MAAIKLVQVWVYQTEKLHCIQHCVLSCWGIEKKLHVFEAKVWCCVRRNILWKLALGKVYQLNSLILGVAIHLRSIKNIVSIVVSDAKGQNRINFSQWHI